MTKGERDFNNFLLTPDGMTFEGKYDMPIINGMKMKKLKEPKHFVEFHCLRRIPMDEREKTVVHFFTPDFLFERVWYHPRSNLEFLKQFKAVCSPDFSQYTDMPRSMAIWNSYRKQWLGRYWQENGIKVIPTVTWSDEDSFEYCFDGMPHDSLVAVSSVGCEKSLEARENFYAGFMKMQEVLNPSQILFYGNKPHWLENAENVVFIAPAYKHRFNKAEKEG